MKESLKWIVMYNCRLPNNHPRLFNKCKKFEKEGKLSMYNYKEVLKKPEHILDLMDNCEEDPLEIVPRGQRDYIGELPMSEAVNKLLKAPKTYLKSVISVWFDPESYKYTRFDVGAKELKYLFELEEHNPKWPMNYSK